MLRVRLLGRASWAAFANHPAPDIERIATQRKREHCAGRLHAGSRFHAVDQLLVDLCARFTLLVFAGRQDSTASPERYLR